MEKSAARNPEEEPQPIPARMLNEFVYCQRLFYYEFVEGVFVESADTLRGGAIHQRVDSGDGSRIIAPKRTGFAGQICKNRLRGILGKLRVSADPTQRRGINKVEVARRPESLKAALEPSAV
jgi:hypothetical protein